MRITLARILIITPLPRNNLAIRLIFAILAPPSLYPVYVLPYVWILVVRQDTDSTNKTPGASSRSCIFRIRASRSFKSYLIRTVRRLMARRNFCPFCCRPSLTNVSSLCFLTMKMLPRERKSRTSLIKTPSIASFFFLLENVFSCFFIRLGRYRNGAQ